jgi:hypothetical protein
VFSWFVFYTLYLFLQASGLTLMLWIIFKPKYCKSKVCVLCFPEWFDWGKHLSCPFLNKLIHLLKKKKKNISPKQPDHLLTTNLHNGYWIIY